MGPGHLACCYTIFLGLKLLDILIKIHILSNLIQYIIDGSDIYLVSCYMVFS